MTASATTIRCEDMADLLPAYALGALDRDEAARVAGHLARCATCRAALTTYESVVDQINGSMPAAAPSGLRDRVLAATKTGAAPAPALIAVVGGDTKLEGRRGRSKIRVLAVGLAAAAAIALISAVAVLAILLADTQESRDDAEAAEQELASYLSVGGAVMKLTSYSAANYGYSFGQGSLVTAPGKPPMIVVGGCPKSGKNREYRVWVERDGDRSRVGLIDVGDGGTGWLAFELSEPLSSYDSVGVTMVTGEDQSARADLFVGFTARDTT